MNDKVRGTGKRHMRVLHLVPYYKPAWTLGGPVFATSSLCEGLARLGIDVEVFTTNVAGKSDRLQVPTEKTVMLEGVRVTYLPTFGYWRFFYAPKLLPLLLKRIEEFDLVHVSGSFTYFQIACAMALLRNGIPFVVSPHGSFMSNALKREVFKRLKKQLFINLVESRVMTKAAGVHCGTEMERQSVAACFPYAETFVIPNAVDLASINDFPMRGCLRKELEIDDSSFVFLYLGRLHSHKGLDLTIEAFGGILQRGLDADLIVAGRPELGSDREWRDIAGRYGASQRVHFLGHVSGDRKLQCIADSDAFVLNSHSENFGISAVEAMVSGLPVIVSDQVGICDWVSKHRAGLVVPQNVLKITEAMSQMIEDSESYRELARATMFQARMDFNPDVIAEKMLNQYRSILDSRLREST